MMRVAVLGVVIGLAASGGLAQSPPAATPPASPAATAPAATATPLVGGADFISPAGEPVRSTDALSGAEHWFRQVDKDGDGRITPAEFRADFDRFFGMLDTDHDGELGPQEIERYETEVAPEIRVASSYGDVNLQKTDDDGHVTPPPYPDRLGAGRFGYLDMPEPVVSADANFDRAVQRREFDAAAVKRFKLLDANGDGVITRDELPALSTKIGKPRGGERGSHGGGRRGGGHRGGGMGGMGGMGGRLGG